MKNFLIGVANMCWLGYVLSIMWNWFITTLGVMSLTFVHGIGILYTVKLTTIQVDFSFLLEAIKADELVDKQQSKYHEKLIKKASLVGHIFYFFIGLTVLGMGAILHYLM